MCEVQTDVDIVVTVPNIIVSRGEVIWNLLSEVGEAEVGEVVECWCGETEDVCIVRENGGYAVSGDPATECRPHHVAGVGVEAGAVVGVGGGREGPAGGPEVLGIGSSVPEFDGDHPDGGCEVVEVCLIGVTQTKSRDLAIRCPEVELLHYGDPEDDFQ